jgi:diguanylate cyclase (GGDEF)-like protein
MAKAERDVVALGIAAAALIMFVGTGGTVVPQLMRSWLGVGGAPDSALTNALLLNIALLIFGWRRYADLQGEVRERRKAEAKAHELAAIDPLTGVLNRRTGGPAIHALLVEAAASQRDVAVLMVDLDNFKQINDVNGHSMGDKVLAETARRIEAVLPAGGVLARIGGDEFACAVAYEPEARDTIDRIANAMLDSIATPIEDRDSRMDPRVSIGIASSGDRPPADGTIDGDTLVHRADIAMYHAKKRGRHCFQWFEPQMESDIRFRNELEMGIRRGIGAGEFVPYYEQQIDLPTGELVGFEMLARWQSPQFGLVNPEVFIPIAEEIELIAEMSEALIRQALIDARDWHESLSLSVNVSPVQLRDPWFAQKLLKLLNDAQFPPERFEIEITESCLHEDLGTVRTIVTSLKNQGVKISLDDFGTGYSSLSQLRSLPFDRLKIDRSFVGDLCGDETNAELVEAIVSLGRGLSLPVTAEGVETTAILEALRKIGPLKGQGYLYGKPQNAADTRKRLAGLQMLRGTARPAATESLEPAASARRKAS